MSRHEMFEEVQDSPVGFPSQDEFMTAFQDMIMAKLAGGFPMARLREMDHTVTVQKGSTTYSMVVNISEFESDPGAPLLVIIKQPNIAERKVGYQFSGLLH